MTYKSRVVVKTSGGLVAYNSSKNFKTLESARKDMRTTTKQFKGFGMKVVKAGVLDMSKLRK